MKNLPKCFLASFCFLLAMLFNNNVQAQQSLTSITGWNAYVHLPSTYATSGKTYPTIVFFPGLGEVGTSAGKVIQNGPGAYITQGWNGNVVVNGSTVEFIVISIQPAAAYPNEIRLNQAIQAIKSAYRVDNNRLYLTGLSHGGWCSSTFVSGDAYGGPYTYASQVAAVVTVEGMRPDDNSPYPNLFDNFAKAGGRYLGFEQALDNRDTKTVVDRMNATTSNSAIYVPTNFGGGGHCCWEQFYGGNGNTPVNFNLDGVSQNIYQWMAKQSLGGSAPIPPPASNTPPVANAGTDKTITLPVNTTTLAGAGMDADGTVGAYKWTLFYGPSMASISNSTSANASVSGLIQGAYQFDLTVTDNNGATATDRVQVTVNAAAAAPNQAPAADAGSDKTITLPINTAVLTGSGSDPDGTISAYAWTKTAGPSAGNISNATAASASATGLVQGTYQFQLKVTDNSGATATDVMQVTVNAAATGTDGNQLPVVNAGPDVSVTGGATYASLNGNGNDADGWMTAWQWRKLTGPSSEPVSNANTANAGAGGLVTGVYTFELQGTDNGGGTARDTLQVTVGVVSQTPPANGAPVANAGADINITLPANTATLRGSGSDNDGTVTAYAWTKISGPAATITNANAATANLSGMAEGVYVYELKVTDNGNATATDRVQVTVNAAPATSSKMIRVNVNGGTTYNNTQWNNWNTVSALTSAKFNYDDATVSNINAVLGAQAMIADNGSSYAGAATLFPPAVFRFNSANTSNRTLTIKGLDRTKKYDFEFFGSRASTGNKTIFQIGNLKDTVNTDNNINDVARLSDIAPDNSGNVIVTLSRIGTWNYLAGFTIGESGSGTAAFTRSSGDIMGGVSTSITDNGTSVKVFPNPFVSTINVTMDEKITGKYTITLTSVSGSVLYTKTGTKGAAPITETINASRLGHGNYFIQVVTDSGKTTLQVQKTMPQATQY
jgi:hypothetical protein